MTQYALPLRQELIDWLGPFPESGKTQLLLTRIADGLTKRGYIIGSGGVQFIPPPPVGLIVVDTDRDPTADYNNWSPNTLSSTEVNQANIRAALAQFHIDVAATHTSLAQTIGGGANPQGNLVQRITETRAILDGLVTRFDQLVTLLEQKDLLK